MADELVPHSEATELELSGLKSALADTRVALEYAETQTKLGLVSLLSGAALIPFMGIFAPFVGASETPYAVAIGILGSVGFFSIFRGSRRVVKAEKLEGEIIMEQLAIEARAKGIDPKPQPRELEGGI